MTGPDLPRPERILIIKPSSLGDVVSAIPVLAGLRRTFPQVHITWLVTPACAPILTGQTDLDETILFDRRHFGRIGRNVAATRDFLVFCRNLRRRRFDWVIDLQGLFRSGFLSRVTGAAVRAGFAEAREFAGIFYTHSIPVRSVHTVHRNIDLACALGVDARADDLALTVTDEAKEFAESFMNEQSLRRGEYLIIAPGTRWPSKLYPTRHWRKVVAELSRDAPVILTGSDADRRMCADLAGAGDSKVFNLAGLTTLPQIVALISAAGAVVCCDSSANFIAPAVGTPFITLIGPTRPERTGPPGPMGKALVADTPCTGCLKRRCRHNTCMQLIDPEQVIAAAQKAFSRRPPAVSDAEPYNDDKTKTK